jgi:hypothetical protein
MSYKIFFETLCIYVLDNCNNFNDCKNQQSNFTFYRPCSQSVIIYDDVDGFECNHTKTCYDVTLLVMLHYRNENQSHKFVCVNIEVAVIKSCFNCCMTEEQNCNEAYASRSLS